MTLKESIRYLEEEIESYNKECFYPSVEIYGEILLHVQVVLNKIKKKEKEKAFEYLKTLVQVYDTDGSVEFDNDYIAQKTIESIKILLEVYDK